MTRKADIVVSIKKVNVKGQNYIYEIRDMRPVSVFKIVMCCSDGTGTNNLCHYCEMETNSSVDD